MKPQTTPKQRNRAPRIESLSVLPVFLDLRGKTAVIVGDGNAALWKLELLASAGAKVRYICKQPTQELLDLLSNGRLDISVETEDWCDLDFSGAAIIIADIAHEEAATFLAYAQRFTSMVNLVDQPDFCTFQFGSIVNKSPLVIGISTSGAGPVLAQYLRNLIEAILPDSIQNRVKRAAAIRIRVNARLASTVQRRKYWSAYFGRSFGFHSSKEGDCGTTHIVRVSSVENLTLADIRQMQGADRIYYCNGVDQAILSYGRREAQRIEVKSFDEVASERNVLPRSVFIAPAAVAC